VTGSPGGQAAVAEPGWAEGEAVAVTGGFDDAADAHAVDGAVDVVSRLGAPDGVGVEGDGDEDVAPAGRSRCRGELSIAHAGSSAVADDAPRRHWPRAFYPYAKALELTEEQKRGPGQHGVLIRTLVR
jgi:hypothetical protein